MANGVLSQPSGAEADTVLKCQNVSCGATTMTATTRPSKVPKYRSFREIGQSAVRDQSHGEPMAEKIRKSVRGLRIAARTHARASTRSVSGIVHFLHFAALMYLPPAARSLGGSSFFDFSDIALPCFQPRPAVCPISRIRPTWRIFGALCWPSSFSPRNSPSLHFGVWQSMHVLRTRTLRDAPLGDCLMFMPF
jgi:hypothetical protein